MASSVASTVVIPLASFLTQARGIKFYDVLSSWIHVGQQLTLQLEPSNPYDGSCIALWLATACMMLGHVAREAAVELAPLLRCGLVASG